MSCRVLKRDMEYAMMDALVKESLRYGINTVYGYYYPTAKNKMVQDFYLLQGFEKWKRMKAGRFGDLSYLNNMKTRIG